MSSIADDAVFRIMLRNLAPGLKQSFKDIADAWSEFIGNIYLSCSHRPGGDLTNPRDSIMEYKSILSQNVITGDITKKTDTSSIDDIFPVCAVLIEEAVELWNQEPAFKQKPLTNFDCFLLLRYKTGTFEDEVDSIEIQIRTRAGVTPPRSKIVQ